MKSISTELNGGSDQKKEKATRLIRLSTLKTLEDEDETSMNLFRNSKEKVKSPLATPNSPQRKELMREFLQRKLGSDKLEKIENVLGSKNDPQNYLKSAESDLLKMLGSEHKECISMLHFILPQANH